MKKKEAKETNTDFIVSEKNELIEEGEKGTDSSGGYDELAEKLREEAIVKESKRHFLCLGVDEEDHFNFYDFHLRHIWKISTSDPALKSKYKNLAPEEFWWSNFAETDNKGNTKLIISNIISFLRVQSKRAGLFSDERLLNVGVFKIKDKFYFNSGENIFDENLVKLDFKEIPGNKLFTPRHEGAIWEPPKIKMGLDGRLELLEIIKSFNFKNQFEPYLVLGWLCLCPWGEILKRRPHIWLTGDRGSGKTTLLQMMARAVGLSDCVGEGEDSAAGIRQYAKRFGTSPVFIDEFEPTSFGRRNLSVENILKAMISNFSGSKVRKANTTQNGEIYKIKSCFAVGSIQTKLNRDNLVRRVACVELGEWKGEANLTIELVVNG